MTYHYCDIDIHRADHNYMKWKDKRTLVFMNCDDVCIRGREWPAVATPRDQMSRRAERRETVACSQERWHCEPGTHAASDWSILTMWPEYRSLMGHGRSCDLNTGLWVVETYDVNTILASDWPCPGPASPSLLSGGPRLVTWPLVTSEVTAHAQSVSRSVLSRIGEIFD